jgi:hypothetical protein
MKKSITPRKIASTAAELLAELGVSEGIQGMLPGLSSKEVRVSDAGINNDNDGKALLTWGPGLCCL